MTYNNYYISVGEPWDYEGPDGSNIIKGEILKIVSKDCIIFKASQPIELDNIRSSIIILRSRHVGIHFTELEENKPWTIGGSLMLSDLYEEMSEKELENNSKYFIIGGLRRQ
jgi:hypothetical protein